MSAIEAIAEIISGDNPGWTPERLIAVFCREELRSSYRAAYRDEEAHGAWHAGFCSYAGKNAYGPGIDGFDDGHELWGLCTSSGWVLIQDPGDRQFPYSFHMAWAKDGVFAELSYCEGDFGIWLFDDLDALKGSIAVFRKWEMGRANG